MHNYYSEPKETYKDAEDAEENEPRERLGKGGKVLRDHVKVMRRDGEWQPFSRPLPPTTHFFPPFFLCVLRVLCGER
jgi:hypothetical protein